MIVVGLTGSIGMGKTEVAKAFAGLGYPVFDADAEVHRLLAEDSGVIAAVASSFPSCVRDNVVDRSCLGVVLEKGDDSLHRLEQILHPRVRDAEDRFLVLAAASQAALAVLEVPLLFESGTDALCDVIVVASAPEFMQVERVLARPGMTRKRLDAILARQMSDAEKRARADHVVDTSGDPAGLLRQVAEIAKMLTSSERPRET